MNTNRLKKAASLKKYYAEVTEARAEKVTEILNLAARQKLIVPNMTRLSEYVASRLSEIEGSPVAGSTIRRNAKYKELLLDYMIKVCPENLPNKQDKAIDASLIRRSFQLQINEKEREISELQQKLDESKSLLEKRLQLEYIEKLTANATSTEQFARSNDESDESVFELLFWALKELKCMEFSADKGYIYDEAEGQVLMSRDKYPKFFNWLSNKV